MNSLEEIPFKILGPQEDPMKEVELVSAPELTLPDCLHLLQETEVRTTPQPLTVSTD